MMRTVGLGPGKVLEFSGFPLNSTQRVSCVDPGFLVEGPVGLLPTNS